MQGLRGLELCQDRRIKAELLAHQRDSLWRCSAPAYIRAGSLRKSRESANVMNTMPTIRKLAAKPARDQPQKLCKHRSGPATRHSVERQSQRIGRVQVHACHISAIWHRRSVLKDRNPGGSDRDDLLQAIHLLKHSECARPS